MFRPFLSVPLEVATRWSAGLRGVIALLAVPLLAGCFTDPVVEGPETGSSSGSLSVEALTLSWKPGSTWAQGQCTDLTLTNGGQPLADWTLVLRLNAPVATLLSSWGATVSPGGDGLTITPIQQALEYGQKVEFQYCAEPPTWPVSIVDARLEPADESSPTPKPSVTGSVQDESIVLVYKNKGSSNGGTCLEMTVTNISSTAVSGWWLQLTMSGPVHWTDAWSCTPVVSGNSLKLYPLAGSESLSAYQGKPVTVCFDPLVHPISMDATVTQK